jgi:Zn-dependent protease with chaperone function
LESYQPKEDLENVNAPASSTLMDFVILLAGFAGIFAIVFSFLIFIGEQAALHMSHQTEEAIFSKLNIPLSSSTKPPETVSQIWNTISQQTGFAADIGLICDNNANAFALPGKKVYLTSELLKNVKSNRGLAFVMAHELGHIFHRDHLRGLGRLFGVLTTSLIFGISNQGVGAAQTLQTVVARSFDRKQEAEADAYALSLMRKTFKSVDGSSEFFQYLSTLKDMEQNAPPTFLSTHPNVDERLLLIQKEEVKKGSKPSEPSLKIDLTKEINALCL